MWAHKLPLTAPTLACALTAPVHCVLERRQPRVCRETAVALDLPFALSAPLVLIDAWNYSHIYKLHRFDVY